MDDRKEDTSQNFSTVLFLILFLFFALSTSGNSGSLTSSSASCHSQNKFDSGELSSQSNAIISAPVSLPDLQKYCGVVLHNTRYISSLFLNKISEYNRRIAQKINLIQKSRLSIEATPDWRLYYHLSSIVDDSLPVLS
jgi:hypothetical protein